jgi:hypothetical protein
MSNPYLVPDVDNITPDDLAALGLEDMAIRSEYLITLLVVDEGLSACPQSDAQAATQALRRVAAAAAEGRHLTPLAIAAIAAAAAVDVDRVFGPGTRAAIS